MAAKRKRVRAVRRTIKVSPVARTAAEERDSKLVGLMVSFLNGTSTHFAGGKWRWNRVLGELMLEVVVDGVVNFQAPAHTIKCVQGQTYTQGMWRSVEYPA